MMRNTVAKEGILPSVYGCCVERKQLSLKGKMTLRGEPQKEWKAYKYALKEAWITGDKAECKIEIGKMFAAIGETERFK